MTLILFNKPFGVICQFSPHPSRPSLADFLKHSGIYPAGRLDADSEGLILLTDDGSLQQKISHPKYEKSKTYLVQVEGLAQPAQLAQLRAPMQLNDFTTQGCKAVRIEPPHWLWPRKPPVRERPTIPTDWLALTLTEGKNRQVRRMTAAVGLPTLRLVRQSIGPISLATHPLLPGEWCEIDPAAWTDD
jgi:23S rRNA pseudouridine2457 synthase